MIKYAAFTFVCLVLVTCLEAQPKKGKTPAQPSMAEMMKMAQAELDKMDPAAKRMMDSLGLNPNGKIEVPALPKVTAGNKTSATKPVTRKIAMPVLQTPAQVQSFLAGMMAACVRNIDIATRTETDKLLTGATSPASVSLILLTHRSPTAALYASIKVAQQQGNSRLALNNCGFLLNQTGYPDRAIPVFNYLLQAGKQPIILNNLGQAQLALGLNSEAKKSFSEGLKLDSASREMHAGMARILLIEKQPEPATGHIRKSLKAGYSEEVLDMADEAGIKLTYDDVKQPVPEYFNPNKLKPAEPIASINEWDAMIAERESQADRVNDAREKTDALAVKLDAGLNPSGSMDALPQVMGYAGKTAIQRQALKMQQLIMEAMVETISARATEFNKRSEEAYREFEKTFDVIQHASYKDRFARCDAHTSNLEVYLGRSKEAADAYTRFILPKVYEWYNGLVYWEAFLTRGDAYKTFVSSKIGAFFEQIAGMSSLQKLDAYASWVYQNCKNNKEEKKKHELATLEAESTCPVSISLNAFIGDLTFSCDGFGLEGGSLVKIGVEYEAKTGEYTLGIGLGKEIDLLVAKVGAKAMVRFTVDRNFSPADFGVQAEAGASAHIGPVNMEEKIVGAVGISSVDIHVNHGGNEISIYNVDALK